MNRLHYLIVFTLLSCSQLGTKPAREVASSGMPARIVNIIEPTPKEVTYSEKLEVLVKIQAFRFGTLVANNRLVNFEVLEGDAHFKKTSLETDEKGFAQSFLNVKSYGQAIKLKIRVDNVIKYHEINVLRPAKFIGEYSLKNSKLNSEQTSIKADGNSKLKFKLQIYDESNNKVDAFGLNISLVSSTGEKVRFTEASQGLYIAEVSAPIKAGMEIYSAEVDNQKIGEAVSIKFSPVVSFKSSDFVISNLSSQKTRISFPLIDLSGQRILPNDAGEILALKNGEGEVTKVSYDQEKNLYNFDFIHPNKDGTTNIGVSVNGVSYWANRAIVFKFNPILLDKIFFEVEKKKIIPSGYDPLAIKVIFKDENDQSIRINNQEQFPTFEFEEGKAKVIGLAQTSDGVFSGQLVPAQMTKKLKVLVIYEKKVVSEKELEFDFRPITEKISNKKQSGSGLYGNDINYKIDNLNGWGINATGNIIGFSLSNKGSNDIVPRGCASDSDDNNCQSNRDFDFEFDDQARQNTALIVTDIPTDSLSHMMHAWFYFFPRKVLPHAYYSEDKTQIIVVLPTEEKVIFDAKTKQIIGGVLEEGPMDLGPSRHTRKFPLIRYKGYGVVLRINARGNDARIGQFNNNRIAGDFGNSGAKDVMIYRYNSATDKPEVCYALKSDFWPQKDINPIPFKYFNDQDFNAFLKSKCSFSLNLD